MTDELRYVENSPELKILLYKINTDPAPATAMKTFQQIRLDMVAKIVENGLPDDLKSAMCLNNILSSGEMAAATSYRLGIGDDSSTASIDDDVIAMLDALDAGKDPFRIENPSFAPAFTERPEALPEINTVEGQMVIGVDPIDMTKFSASQGQ